MQDYEGESLASLVARFGAVEDFRQPMRVVRQIRPPTSSLVTLALADPDSEFGRTLAEFLDVSRATLARLTSGTEDVNTRSINGCRLNHEFVSVEHRRYCPQCLSEAPFHRALWDLTALSVCPVHAVRLLDRCPNPDCRRLVRWTTSSLTRCHSSECSASLTDAKAAMVPEGELDGARAIAAILRGEIPPGAAPMAAGDLVEACFRLGVIARGYHRYPRPQTFLRAHGNEAHLVLRDGWQILSCWPSGFHAFMDGLREQAGSRKGRYGVVKAYGALPLMFAHYQGERFSDFLSEAFTRHVAGQQNLATRAANVRQYRVANDLHHSFMTASEAATALGVSYERLASLAEEHDLYLVAPDGSGASALMHADRVKALRDHMATRLTKKDTYELLNISKEAFWTVESQRILEPRTTSDDEVWYARADVEALLTRLEEGVGAKPAKVRWKDLRSLPDLARIGPNIGELIRRILDGAFKPTAVDDKARGLSRLFLSPSVLSRSDGLTMSVVRASELLGVKQEVAYHWVRVGLLATVDVDIDWRIVRHVSVEALDEFRRLYVTGVELAAAVGSQSRRYSSKHLMELGLTPISGPNVDGARQFLFRRADVAKANLKPLQLFAEGKVPPKKENEALLLVRAIGKAAKRELGLELWQHSNRFVDQTGMKVVQVVTGRRSGFTGAFRFAVSDSQIRRLDKATHGYLALGFVGDSRFLLMPWQKEDRRHQGPSNIEYIFADPKDEGLPSELSATWIDL